jgi:hypothetical protein
LIITRTWVATDDCGNSSTCNQFIAVTDGQQPIITCPVDVTIECSDSTDPMDTGSASATDNCDGSPVLTYSDMTVGGSCPQEMTIIRTWIATDDCGNSSTCIQNIFVQDTTPPVITCPPDITIDCSSSPVAGTFSGSSFSEDFDGIGGSTSGGPGTYSFPAGWLRMNVDLNTPSSDPRVSWINEAWERREDFPLNDVDSAAFSTSYYNPAGTADDWMWTPPIYIGANGVLTWNAKSYLDNFPEAYSVRVMVGPTEPTGSDGFIGNMALQSFQIFGDNAENPTWTPHSESLALFAGKTIRIAFRNFSEDQFSMLIDDVVVTSDAGSGLATATAFDNCDSSPTITYSDVTTAGSCAQEVTIMRTWIATDGCGNSSTCIQNISVQDTMPPVITCPPDVTIDCSANPSPTSFSASGFQEDFDDIGGPTSGGEGTYSFPTGWLLVDVDNRVPEGGVSWVNDAWERREDIAINPFDSVAYSTSWYFPAGAADDWMWTPSISIGGNGMLTWNADALDSNFPDGYEVRVMVGPTQPTGSTGNIGNMITNSTVIFSIAAENSSLTPRSASLAAYAGQTIRIAWRNNSNNAFLLFIDDVVVTSDAGIGVATAEDACDPQPTLTYTDMTVSGACGPEFTINRMWIATDDCGNSSTCLQTISVQDTTPPSLICPPNLTLECSDDTSPDGPAGMATATDSCGGMVIISFLDDVDLLPPCDQQSFQNPQSYIIQRGWLAVDECGNTSICIQEILVQDTTAPMITCPVDLTIECTASTSPIGPNGTGSASATDNCNPAPIIFSTDSIIAGACPHSYTLLRTWIATDGCDTFNVSTCIQTITVIDTLPPIITCPVIPNDTIDCPLTPTFDLATATDNCDSAVTITFADVTTPGTCPAELTVTRTWTATDDCGNSSTCSASIFVQDTTPPVITCPVIPIDTIDCPLTPTFGLATATDACDAVVDVTFADVTTPGTCPAELTVTRTWTATDDCGNSSTCSASIFVQDTTPPVITCPVIPNDTIDCPLVPTFGLATATDACDAVVDITFADVTTPGTCPAELNVTRTWTATDDCGNSSTCSATIFVQDTTAPVITCPVIPNDTIDCPLTPAFGLATATDACDAVVDITFADVTTPGTCPAELTVTRTWTATDDCGNSSTCSASIFVQDTIAPVITCPVIPNDTIDCPLVPTFGLATATDACDATVSITFADVTTPGTCPAELTVTRTWTATDDCGNSSTCSASIFVQDTTAPVITCPVIPNDTIDCPLTPTFGLATATDACDAVVDITFADVTTPGTCPAELTVTRTWTATDDCGNSSTCSASIFVQDTTAPVITCPVIPNDTIDCPLVPTFGLATATDACDAVVDITFADVTTPGTCPAELTVTRTWTATDDCGNSSTCSASIFVQDTTPPVITCPVIPNDTIDCPLTPTFGLATATDACDAVVDVTFADVTTPGTCPAELTVTRTWTATDDCGNSSTCSASIFVQDTTPPVITCPVIPNDTIDCPLTPTFGLATATDACDAVVDVTFADVTTPGTCPAELTVTRTWTATDDCGNSSTCSASIFVQDTTAPVITCPVIPNDTIDCPLTPTFALATATDACDATVSITFADVTTPGTCPAELTVTRTWTATDDCGNSSTCSASIFVQDTTPPVITCPVIPMIPLIAH